ncbi:MAG: hypothetical protein ACRD5W_06985 [Candidatus Acidiferrales bacterium]
MRRFLLILTVTALALLISDPAEAQRRMRTRVVSAPQGTQVVRTTPSGAVTNPSGQFVSGTPVVTSGNSVERLLNGAFPAPGLGFDFTHHAAINRNLATRALVDPVTQHRLALERQIRRETPVAVAPAFPVVVNSIVVNVVPQPPVVIIQEPEPEAGRDYIEQARYYEGDAPAAGRRPARSGPRDDQPAAPRFFYEPPPQREDDDLVFIRRDGTLISVVAFTARDDRIIYITRDGHRRTLALADLDLAATRDINEARGSLLRLQ